MKNLPKAELSHGGYPVEILWQNKVSAVLTTEVGRQGQNYTVMVGRFLIRLKAYLHLIFTIGWLTIHTGIHCGITFSAVKTKLYTPQHFQSLLSVL